MDLYKNTKIKSGFTIIELLVVIAIISVLAAIVMTNVTQLIGKARLARANVDVRNIEKGLIMFYEKYGYYPYSYYGDPGWTEFFSSDIGGEGTPYLTIGGQDHYLSETYNLDWTGYNAGYFTNHGFYYAYLWDDNGDGTIGCGVIQLYNDWWYYYGTKYILCQDCGYCNSQYDDPFTTYPR